MCIHMKKNVYVCVCVCMCVYTYTHTHTYIYIFFHFHFLTYVFLQSVQYIIKLSLYYIVFSVLDYKSVSLESKVFSDFRWWFLATCGIINLIQFVVQLLLNCLFFIFIYNIIIIMSCLLHRFPTLPHHSSLLSIAFGRSSKLHPVSSQSCCR